VNEIVHGHDAVNVTRIVTKEDTTKGSEGAHHVCLPGDRGLDPATGNNTVSHDE
jgi:hypothetical protein